MTDADATEPDDDYRPEPERICPTCGVKSVPPCPYCLGDDFGGTIYRFYRDWP